MHTLKNSGDFQCVIDEQIIALYWARQEAAIAETALKYGGLCTRVAGNILASREDSEECVNDTYFAAFYPYYGRKSCGGRRLWSGYRRIMRKTS